jgi:hypothetical protein
MPDKSPWIKSLGLSTRSEINERRLSYRAKFHTKLSNNKPNMKNAKPHCEQTRNPEFDPIEWAIIGVVVGGSSLILAIKVKIDATRKIKQEKANKEARVSNQVRLKGIQRALDEMREIFNYIYKIGKLVEYRGESSSHKIYDGI